MEFGNTDELLLVLLINFASFKPKKKQNLKVLFQNWIYLDWI